MGFIVLFVAVQLIVPTIALFGPRASRFGWQMYSGAQTRAEFVMVDANGREHAVDVHDYVGQHRAEIDLTGSLPAYICEVEPRAALVRIEPLGDQPTVDVPCSP